MELVYRNNNNLKIIVLFLGWSADENTAKNIEFKGYDVIFLYDYNSLKLDIDHIIESYSEVVLIGWSFGVWVASQWAMGREFCSSIAINGTPLPVDDEFGIQSKVFNFTLRSIKSKGIEQFNIRTYGKDIKMLQASERDFGNQYDELCKLGENSKTHGESNFNWDWAIVGSEDLIFPVENMINYWNKKSKFAPIIINIPHYPFAEEGMSEIKKILDVSTQ